MPAKDISYLMGQIDAKLASLDDGQKTILSKVDGIETRLRTVENKSTLYGGIAGGVLGVGTALITASLKSKLGIT